MSYKSQFVTAALLSLWQQERFQTSGLPYRAKCKFINEKGMTSLNCLQHLYTRLCLFCDIFLLLSQRRSTFLFLSGFTHKKKKYMILSADNELILFFYFIYFVPVWLMCIFASSLILISYTCLIDTELFPNGVFLPHKTI